MFAPPLPLLRLLDRQALRRQGGIPTITVLSGCIEQGIQLWHCWAAGKCLQVVQSCDPHTIGDAWTTSLAAARDLTVDAWSYLAWRTQRPELALRATWDAKSAYDVEHLCQGLPLDCDTDLAAAACSWLIQIRTQGASPAPKDCGGELDRALHRFERPGVRGIEALAQVVPTGILPTLLLTPELSLSRRDWLVSVVRLIAVLVPCVPALHVAIVVEDAELRRFLNTPQQTRAHTLLREGIVAVATVETEPNQLPELPPAVLSSAKLVQAFDDALEKHQKLIQASSDEEARSAAERFLFELLEATPQTRGHFELNGSLAFRFGSSNAEIDLLAQDWRLTVEIDGFYHFRDPEAYRRDRRKDWELQRRGFLVVRVLADDVLSRTAEVLNTILAAVEHCRRAMNTLITMADTLPGCVIVVASLEDYYTSYRQHLIKPKLDRLERDPEPIRLKGPRTSEEIQQLVAQRLRFLFDEAEVPFQEQTPTFPFTAPQLAGQAGKRTRDVLDFLRLHHQRCIQAGAWVEPVVAEPAPAVAGPVEAGKADVLPLERQWNDFLTTFKETVPDEETSLAALLAWGIKQCSDEMPPDYHFGAETNGRLISVDIHQPANAVAPLYVAVCEKGAQGNGLLNQIVEVEKKAGEIPMVVVRTTSFPGPTSKVGQRIGALIKRGGRPVVVENTDWRRLLAFRQFHSSRHKEPAFTSWLREIRPLSQLNSLKQILALDTLLKARPAPVPAPVPAPPPPPVTASPPAPVAGPLVLGTRSGLLPEPVLVEPEELRQHAAFLGASGSGKTTAALNLLEQLLERGIPAVLLDRKGDLCRYADPTAWDEPLADPAQEARRKALRQRVDVALFTPGEPNGRPLTIPVVPADMAQLNVQEREQIAGYAAAALGSMMGYRGKGTGSDQTRLAILRKAIEVLGSIAGQSVNLGSLYQLVEAQDATLVAAVGGFDSKHYKKLADDLLTLSLHNKQLLEGAGEQLDIDLLLGHGRHQRPGTTRLSIISTRSLGDALTVDFWVAQLLVALGRWIGRHPASALQGVFLFDEADQYLPALRQPATKAPMENLLKRARSAGIGLMLATQSPGDFDYKCRDTIRAWVVGCIKEKTAVGKLESMLSVGKSQVSGKLATQGTGQFHLLRENEVCSLKTHCSFLKTLQLPEDHILGLACKSRLAAKGG